MLNPYKESSEEYANLYADFDRIKKAYRHIDISYTPGEPETIEKDGRLVVIQNEESIVTMSEEQLSAIIVIIVEIRDKLTSE